MSYFKKKDLGKVNFGKFKGLNWNDPLIKDNYLEYLMSDDCSTAHENKEIAKQELAQRKLIEGQIEDDILKGVL